MIKANELRIGNLLNDREGNLCKVFELGKNSILAPTINKPTTKLPNEPIPLTEEWLLKFGFIYNDFINGYILDFEDKTLLFMDNGLDLCLMNNESIDCEYVHQLQNLFFALTGTELELKLN